MNEAQRERGRENIFCVKYLFLIMNVNLYILPLAIVSEEISTHSIL